MEEELFEEKGQRVARRRKKIFEFTHSSTRSTILMFAAAVLALILANTPFIPNFETFWNELIISFNVGSFEANISVGHFINDFLMAFFFLVIGLDIKFELTAGELKEPRKAILPLAAGIGGAILPAVLYLVLNGGLGEFVNGWAIPLSNDIAFCLGILALLGSRVPAGLRAFFSTCTVVDDILAILIIAFFYTKSLSIAWLALGILCFFVLIGMNRGGVCSLAPYLIVGGIMWITIYMSGVHATVAGVLLAVTIPSNSPIRTETANRWLKRKSRSAEERYDPGEMDLAQKEFLNEVNQIAKVSKLTIPPITRLNHNMHSFVYFFILPLFAFANAGVAISGVNLSEIVFHPIALGIFFGLCVAKPLGIFLTSYITVRLGFSDLPDKVNWRHMAGGSILGGVGFTMAIFVTNLAFLSHELIAISKVAILSASLVAGLVGFFVLQAEARRTQNEDEDEELAELED